ncbi:MAG: hypothetical protein K1X53_13420, partial [Candidatus Sumerlaeaceae bacterium]|nr:hypothetical protein [Candidatus Sumerlaeaceae bacterium]
ATEIITTAKDAVKINALPNMDETLAKIKVLNQRVEMDDTAPFAELLKAAFANELRGLDPG